MQWGSVERESAQSPCNKCRVKDMQDFVERKSAQSCNKCSVKNMQGFVERKSAQFPCSICRHGLRYSEFC